MNATSSNRPALRSPWPPRPSAGANSPYSNPPGSNPPGSNPLASEHKAARSCSMAGSSANPVYLSRPGKAPSLRDIKAHAAMRAHVLGPGYPCVMALSAFNRNSYRMATYGALGQPGNATMLCHDIYDFCAAHPAPVQAPLSFIAWFHGPWPADERAHEAAMWRQLQALHEVDRQHFSWSADVASQPSDPRFSFSVGARAFFLIGMHPHASRLARRTQQPVIVFNLHEQFVALREHGKFSTLRDAIQARDLALQGSVNPMAADFGDRSEVAQYAGRAVGRQWACPFAPGAAAND